MNVTDAIHAFIIACKRTNTCITLSLTNRGDRPAVNVEVSSAVDGYLTSEDIRFYFDHFNSTWGGAYSDEYSNVNTGLVCGWTPMYRGWYPLQKEIALSCRLIRIINRYGFHYVYNAIAHAGSNVVTVA